MQVMVEMALVNKLVRGLQMATKDGWLTIGEVGTWLKLTLLWLHSL